ncbi:MAG: SCP2 sterol-binding domain-containing protein [Burkholderiaceae bacterium]
MAWPDPLVLATLDRVLPRVARLPRPLQAAVLRPLLQTVLAEPIRAGRFDFLGGRWIRIEITDLDIGWSLRVEGARLELDAQASAEVRVAAAWRDLLMLASRHEDPDALFFRRRLVIDGDTELGLAVKNLIDGLDAQELPAPVWSALRRLGAEAARQS